MKALYLLQVTKQKLQNETFNKLRNLLHFILKTNPALDHLILEVHFSEEDFGSDLTSHP